MNPSLKDDLLFRRWVDQAVRRGASPSALARVDRLSVFADVREFLSSIRVPTLVLTRSDNAMVPSAFGRYLAENIPGARFTEVPGNDYAPYSGDLDALADQIEEFLTGRRESTGDRVLTTLLFTDIVDSTSRAVALGDRAWHASLDNHDAAVRAVIERYGGSEVNTTGDGFLARFDSPTQAVRAGHEIVTSAAQADLAVRVGIHSGECERRGDDLSGITVHIAARVADRAEPSEVLVSRTVRDLLAGSELRFAERGEHRLKGLPDEWQLFALES
jgi:class 3 adenylate cyclase